MLGKLQARLKARFAFPKPKIVAINIAWVAEDLKEKLEAGGVNIPLPEIPPISDDGALMQARMHLDDLALPREVMAAAVGRDRFILPKAIDLLDMSACLSLPFPDILDMFSGLTFPGRAGKAYAREDVAAKEPAYQEAPPPPSPAAQERCRHGLPRYMCAVCTPIQTPFAGRRTRSGRSRSYGYGASTKPRTLDVFDLLLPYLQPPIETLLSNPALFPKKRRPYQYQVKGIRFLAQNKSALLGDEMGLGKTIQAIVALQVLFRRGEIRRALILCRRSLLSVWETELSKWAPELFVIKVRGTREEREWLWELPAPIYLTTYETLREDIPRMAYLKQRFDVVILDEVQEIKNPGTKKARAVRQIQATYRWGLSGTPLENSLEDVLAIFRYLQPSLFRESAIVSPFHVREKIRPYILRRRAVDVLKDLPKKTVNEVWLELSPRQRELYDREYQRARSQLSRGGITRVHVFDWINKLKQICNLDPETGESCKVEYLFDQLESITEAGQKALVFSHFPNVTLRRIQHRLQKFDPAVFDGSLNDRERIRLIQAFQETDSPKVLLMSVQTGGVGLTLTRANHVFHFDHWWNPSIARQAEGRAHRIGQKRVVFVYDIYTRDTIEERIYRLLRKKESLFNFVIDDLSEKGVQRLITDEELFALFDLEPPRPKARNS
ncbi:MAG: DEAD/DEAH box helicase [Chloroflexi bacterium]|nr:DEAD/DEAH box helicase [Chloroflexota bacterium]